MDYKIALLILILVNRANAVEVQPGEMKMADGFAKDRIAWLNSPQIQSPPEAKLIEQGWGTLHFGWSVNHHVLQLKGRQYQTGFGSHADAVIEYQLPTDATRLTGLCGLDDTEEARQNPHEVIFSIAVDGHPVWHGAAQTALSEASKFDVDLKNAKVVTFKAKGLGDLTYTPVDFVDLHLMLGDGTSKELGQRIAPAKAAGAGISFVYDGKKSSDFLNNWTLTQKDLPETPFYSQRQFIRTDPATKLECTVILKQYKRFPVVEWTATFKNGGTQDSPILENIRSMDLSLAATDKLLLHHHTGDYAAEDSYEPHVVELKPTSELHFAPQGGRPTDKAWPYFNLENMAENYGMITVVGWPGSGRRIFLRRLIHSISRRVSSSHIFCCIRVSKYVHRFRS